MFKICLFKINCKQLIYATKGNFCLGLHRFSVSAALLLTMVRTTEFYRDLIDTMNLRKKQSNQILIYGTRIIFVNIIDKN